MNIFLPISFNMCFGCTKERYGSLEYPQHMFWLRNKKINFDYALSSKGLIYMKQGSFNFLEKNPLTFTLYKECKNCLDFHLIIALNNN